MTEEAVIGSGARVAVDFLARVTAGGPHPRPPPWSRSALHHFLRPGLPFQPLSGEQRQTEHHMTWLVRPQVDTRGRDRSWSADSDWSISNMIARDQLETSCYSVFVGVRNTGPRGSGIRARRSFRVMM